MVDIISCWIQFHLLNHLDLAMPNSLFKGGAHDGGSFLIINVGQWVAGISTRPKQKTDVSNMVFHHVVAQSQIKLRFQTWNLVFV